MCSAVVVSSSSSSRRRRVRRRRMRRLSVESHQSTPTDRPDPTRRMCTSHIAALSCVASRCAVLCCAGGREIAHERRGRIRLAFSRPEWIARDGCAATLKILYIYAGICVLSGSWAFGTRVSSLVTVGERGRLGWEVFFKFLSVLNTTHSRERPILSR